MTQIDNIDNQYVVKKDISTTKKNLQYNTSQKIFFGLKVDILVRLGIIHKLRNLA